MLFCGGWWWAGRSHCHQLSALLQGLGPMLGPRGLLRLHSHLKEALGQEAGRQSYSLEDGRTLGTLEGCLESAHAEGSGSCVGVCPLTGPVPLGRVVFRPAPGMGPSPGPVGGTWAPDPRSLAPFLPLCSERADNGGGLPTPQPVALVRGGLRAQAPRWKSVWGGWGRRQSVEGWPRPGGLQLFSNRDRRSSLLLLGRSGGSR